MIRIAILSFKLELRDCSKEKSWLRILTTHIPCVAKSICNIRRTDRQIKSGNPAEPRQTGIAEEFFDAGILWVKHGRARAIQKLAESWPKTVHFLSCVSLIRLL